MKMKSGRYFVFWLFSTIGKSYVFAMLLGFIASPLIYILAVSLWAEDADTRFYLLVAALAGPILGLILAFFSRRAIDRMLASSKKAGRAFPCDDGNELSVQTKSLLAIFLIVATAAAILPLGMGGGAPGAKGDEILDRHEKELRRSK